MKKTNLVLLLSILFLASCAQSQYTVITNVDVFDGETIRQDVDFVFKDSVIVAIGKSTAKHKNGASFIDGSGKTILPPLINAHVHIASPENLKEALGVGIFAMMDMFTLDSRANYLRTFNDSTDYAHYYSSNVGATVPNGHGTQYRVQIPTINDTLTAVDFVKDRVSFGADYIKITQENTMAKLSNAQLHEIIEAAHKYHKITVAHISALDDCHELIEHNVDGFAHIWYRMPSFAPVEMLQAMKDKGIFIIPTLSVIEKAIQNTDSSELKNLLTFHQVLEEVNKAYHKNITILAGTDARNYGMNYTTQYFDELVFLSKAGMNNLDVLKAGTSNIYKAFKLKEFDNLTENNIANFILLDGKPHINLKDIYLKKRIWKHGKELIAS